MNEFWCNVYPTIEGQMIGSWWNTREAAENVGRGCVLYRLHVKVKPRFTENTPCVA